MAPQQGQVFSAASPKHLGHTSLLELAAGSLGLVLAGVVSGKWFNSMVTAGQ